MFFVTKEGPVQGGWDLQLGSKSMAGVVQETDKPLWWDIKRNVYGHRGEGRCRGHKADTILQKACLFNRGCDEASRGELGGRGLAKDGQSLDP